MVLHLGPLGPTMINIAAILGTSPTGLPVNNSLFEYQFDLDLKTIFEDRKLHKNFFNYNTLITHFTSLKGEDLKKGEHRVYFSTLRPDLANFSSSEAMGLELASRPIPPHLAREIFKYFFGLKDLLDDEFQISPPKSRCASIFVDWWAAYTKDFFSVLVKKVFEKLFGDRPKRLSPRNPKKRPKVYSFLCGRTIKKAEWIAMATAKRKITPPVKKAEAVVPALSTKRPHPEAETDDESEGPHLVRKSQLAEKTTLNPQLVVETASRVKPSSVESSPDLAGAPWVEPEATTETLIHPQDQNLSIPPQEVTSAFVRLNHFLSLVFL
ncbi:F-box protein [Pyrus ussuriensis x Pyrus communis]|uniref:F-box protein n=1 Tax=Pyrus ussuriensis x Pyrus communis TaxID=2448454 RepID=A0A5N5FBK0_9ROSA|nr:F-box protein [Pyrus ussuriensis x Pyrus communis]